MKRKREIKPEVLVCKETPAAPPGKVIGSAFLLPQLLI
jgi:hypothetical protein